MIKLQQKFLQKDIFLCFVILEWVKRHSIKHIKYLLLGLKVSKKNS